ncbi:MAG: NADH-quinone oxidoreductase subunit M [Myxococcota bacterium]|nr:NADH-quinone oxidoreductase subunit M [Myxococcota bacterium]
MRSLTSRLLIVAALTFATIFACTPAFASPLHPGGRIVLSLPGGASGPLVLSPGQGGRVGTLTIANAGSDALVVSRISILGDEDDVRSPTRLSARFVDGAATSATLAPGVSKDVVVSWMPDKDARARQAFGHVVITSTDEQAGEVAVGFRAQLPTGLGWVGAHVLSVLILLPFFVPLLAGVSRLLGRRDGKLVRRSLMGIAILELLLSLWAFWRFVPELGRADGNEGYQFVERSVWVRSLGAEWYLGVDGVSIALLPLAAGLVLTGLLLQEVERRSDAYSSALALLVVGAIGALVALDLTLLFAMWQMVLLALLMIVGELGRARGEYAAAKLAAYGAIGSIAMLMAFVALSRASGRAFLVDGTAVAHTLSIPELTRTSFAAKEPILGIPFVELVWVLLIVAVAVATPIVPLHGWLVDVLEEAPGGVAVVIAGIVVALGPYLLVRVGLGSVPEGARWAGSSISALGALGVLYGALCAMAQTDLRRFVAYATLANAGVCLFGIGSLTPQGIAAAIAGWFAHGLAAGMLLGFATALERRVHTTELARLGGLAVEIPALGAIAGVGLAVSVGVPGLAGFWGALLSLLGGFVRHPVLAAIMSAAFVASAAAHLRIARQCLLGRVHTAWRRSRVLAPFGGRFPDATRSELLALVPLAVIALLLGLWPGPLLSSMASAVRDVSAAVDPAGPDPTVGGH